jgi:hypothetical protein
MQKLGTLLTLIKIKFIQLLSSINQIVCLFLFVTNRVDLKLIREN